MPHGPDGSRTIPDTRNGHPKVQAQVIIAVWKAVALRNLAMVIDATLIPKLLALSVLYLKPP